MTTQVDFVQPPRIASWLVNLFAPAEEAESILGDLLEEYSHFVSKSGAACARSWYWRQTVKTVAHLIGGGFSVAPWSTAAAIVGGFLLHGLVSGLPNKALSAVTDRYLIYWSNHFEAYMFWATDGMLIAQFIASLFVGCMVALVAKGREMVATMTLGFIYCAMICVAWATTHWPTGLGIQWILCQCASPFAIVVGGAIVRMCRSALTTRPSSA